MFEFLSLLAAKYGLVGLFMVSLLSATAIIPFAFELTLPVFSRLGFNPVLIVVVATFGSLAGTWLNYYIGYLGSAAIKPRKSDISKVKRIMNTYGWFGIFYLQILPIPFAVDLLTIAGGLGRMNFFWFSLVVFLGRLLRYSIATGLFEMIV